ncbi:MAG: sigma 54-dependent Fis family transcriptional regulator [Polyangiaceae bacterium]
MSAPREATGTIEVSPGVVRLRTASIEVLEGPDQGLALHVDRPVVVLGSGADADLVLTDGTVSRAHVRLMLSSEGVRVCDEESKNGTWCDGVRIRDVVLTRATKVRLGTSLLSIVPQAEPSDFPVSRARSFGEVIGVSLAMRHLFSTLERLAKTDVAALLEGESGVGKEVVARALHGESSRAGAAFVALDCGALPASLIESELFGHVKGAFTGASSARVGLFEAADGGTLFLDEIGNLPLELQPKLLRVLESRELRPLGAVESRSVDVRIVAATNASLVDAMHAGTFRQDLYYRLAVARVRIPALRDRHEDILPLAGLFLRRASGDPEASVPEDLAALLESYAWPGNVRELRNVIDRYALLGTRDPAQLFDRTPQPAREDLDLPYLEARTRVLDEFEQRYTRRLLERAGGVVSHAADLAGIARPTLYRMLDRVGLGSRKP